MTHLSTIIDITAENIPQLIDHSNEVPVLIDFWAEWCAPCKTLMPLLERLANEFQGAFILAKVNIDEHQELATQFGVRSVPTVKMVKGGAIVDEFQGALPESAIREFLSAHVKSEFDRLLGEISRLMDNGELEQACTQLTALSSTHPGSHPLLLVEARLLYLKGDNEEARKRLETLPYAIRESAASKQLLDAIELAIEAETTPARAVLEDALATTPDSSLIRYQLASRLLAEKEYDEAVKQLLELIRRDRGFKEGIAQQTLLKIFSLLGDHDERVGQFRRQLASLIM